MTTILVVEDSLNLVALLQAILGEHGYTVRVVRDGKSGVKSALEDEPDLLLLDVGLPYQSGVDVVRELKRNGVNAPALILTAVVRRRSTTDDPLTNIVDVYVAYLRKKLDATDRPKIQTIRGIGYALRPDAQMKRPR